MRTPEYDELFSGDPTWVTCSIGGVTEKDAKYSPDKWTMIPNYTVLEATHGATSKNYKPEYANAKRNGNDKVIYSPENPRGRVTKYDSLPQ